MVTRPTIVINWGDGSSNSLNALSSANCNDSNTIVTRYQGIHTFSGPGDYIISCRDSFRQANIQNIANSANEIMLLQYHLSIPPVSIGNTSPISGNCAHDTWECCNYVYNCGYSDPDGDSLSYKLVPVSNNYTFPPASIDSITGDLTFNPTATGFYSFGIQVDEWRQLSGLGTYLIGSKIRQIQIDVYSLTGVDENSLSNDLSIFPNPTTGNFTLNYQPLSPHEQFYLMDLTGKIVFTQPINIKLNMQPISATDLSNGFYLYRAADSEKILFQGKLTVVK